MDHRGDIYSVGVILYELLTGKLPFAGRSTMDVLLAHATEAPPSFAASGAADLVPAAIETVVLACLAKLPEERPANARLLAERFETALAHEEVVQEQAAAPPPPQTAARLDAPLSRPADPGEVLHTLQAWMPERVALYKLRGFVDDVGGEVVESVPGRIRVRLGGRGSLYDAKRQSAFAWLGLGRRGSLIDMELNLEHADPARECLLHITVTLRSANGQAALDPAWRARCSQIFCDLRGYLMGQSNGVSELGR
jgi:serine/threonine-protein kinase